MIHPPPPHRTFTGTAIRLWATRIAAVAATFMALTAGSAVAANASVGAHGVAPSAAGTNVVGYYYELRNLHTNKCADVENASKSWNAVVHQWTCAHQPHQLWAIEPISNSIYVRLRNANSQLCLASGAPWISGNVVRQLECDDRSGVGNVWILVPDGGSYKLVHYDSGFCLDLNRGSTSNGARIQLLYCDTSSNAQNWYFA